MIKFIQKCIRTVLAMIFLGGVYLISAIWALFIFVIGGDIEEE